MAQDRRECAFRVRARKSERISMANTGCLDLDKHLPTFRSIQIDLNDLEGLSAFKGHCRTCLHGFDTFIFVAGPVKPATRLGWLPRLVAPPAFGMDCTRCCDGL